MSESGKILTRFPEFGAIRVESCGRNRVSIFLNNFKYATNFVLDEKCLDDNKFMAYSQKFMTSIRGLLRELISIFSDQKILENISALGSNKKIFNIRRIKKR